MSKRSISDVATLALAVGALAVAWIGWQNSRGRLTPRIPVPTAVPEWTELVRVASFEPPRVDPSGAHVFLVILEPSCPQCQAVRKAIDSLRLTARAAFQVGYLYFPRPAVHRGAFNASVLAECAREQGKLSAYLDGLLLTDNPVDYAAGTARRLDLNHTLLSKCMKGIASRSVVERHIMAARQLGLRQGPAVLLDGFLVRPPLSTRTLDSAWSSIVAK